MYIFLKWFFLFGSLVLLKILKTVVYCIYSIVITVCYELEFLLKSAENSVLSQNVLPRLKTNSTKYDGLNYTRPPMSYSVDRSIQPDSVDFLIFNLPSGKNVTVRHVNRYEILINVSDVTYDSINNFRHRALTAERISQSVCLRPETTLPIKTLDCSTPLDQHSRASHGMNIQPETNTIEITSDFMSNLHNAGQVLSSEICNASDESSCFKLKISDRVDKFKLNESNSSENKYFENVSLNVPQPIAKDFRKPPSSDVVDLRQENVYPENKITQGSEKKPTGSKSDDDECYSAFFMAMRNAFHIFDNFGKNDHDKENNSTEIKRDEETMEEIKWSDANVHEQEGDCSMNTSLHDQLTNALSSLKANTLGDDCLRTTTLNDELKVKLSSPKVYDEVYNCSIMYLDSKLFEYLTHMVNDFKLELNRDGVDECSPRCQEIFDKLIKDGWSAYIDFLIESPRSIEEIEIEVLKLCKLHYCKSLMTNEDVQVVHEKLINLVQKSQDVNTKPYHGLVIVYAGEINVVLNYIQKYIEYYKDLNTSNAMKRSIYLKEVIRVLIKKRDILFHANDDTIALQKQMQKTVKISPKFIKKNKKRRRR